MRRFGSLVILVLLWAASSAARAQQNAAPVAERDSVRLLFYDDKVLNSPDQLQLLQILLKNNTDTLRLEGVESGVTLAKTGVYLLPHAGTVDPDALSAAEKEVMFFEEAPIYQTPFSTFALDSSDEELSSLINRTAAAQALANGVAVGTRTALSGVLETADGQVLKIVSTREQIQPGAWQPVVYTVYNLNFKGRKASVVVLSRPVGGMGFWRPERKKTPGAPEGIFALNTGGAALYEGIVSSAALAAYYAASQTDVLAFELEDVRALAPFLLGDSTFTPVAVCGNLAAAGGRQNWRKYAVLEHEGIKIGVYSLVSAPSLNPRAALEYGLSVADFKTEGRAIADTLRRQEQVDLVVFLSQLDPDEQAEYLLAVPGNDIVISARNTDTVAGRVSTVDLSNWRKQVNREPALVLSRSALNLGELAIRFVRTGQGAVPVALRELTGGNNPPQIPPGDPYFRYNYKLFADLSALRGAALLPDPRVLWNTFYYTPLAVFNLSANVLKERTGAEAAFVRLRNLPERFPGEVRPEQFARWVPAEKLYVGYIKGSSLAELAKLVDFSAPSSNLTDYSETPRLASSGLSENGRIANIPIDKDEIYKIAFTEELLKDKNAFRPLSSVFDSTSVPNADLLDITMDWLVDTRDARDREADSSFMAFLRQQASSETAHGTERRLYNEGRLGELYALFRDRAAAGYNERLLAFTAHRDDIRPFVRLNLRKLELSFSETDISNASLYGDFSNAKLNSDSQMVLTGALDFYVEYFKDNLRWDNGVSVTYGKTTIYPTSGGSVTSESADDVLFQSELIYKRFNVDNVLGGFLAGPFLSLGYETELNVSSGTNATKIVRGKGGIKLYQGANIKDLYLAGVMEQDYTYSPNMRKFAWETGFALEQNPAPNLRLKYSGYYRNFFRTSSEKATDYLYELALNISAEADVWNNLKFAPYANLYQARGKFTDVAGRNIKYGFALKYSFIYKPFIY